VARVEVRPTDPQPALAQQRERLRRGDFVGEVQVNEDDGGSVAGCRHDSWADQTFSNIVFGADMSALLAMRCFAWML
jgi:hypothetical protein